MADTTSSAAQAKISKRHWWLAALLSLLARGLGHFYAGAWRRGIAFITIEYALASALLWATPYSFWVLAPGFLLFIGFLLLVIVDSARLCRHQPQQQLKPYQRWYVLVPICIVLAIVGEQYVQMLPMLQRARSFHSPTASMLPTLQPGDYFIVRTDDVLPQRGDIVVFRGKDNFDYVKRVSGLPGEHIDINDGLLSVENAEIAHAAAAADGAKGLCPPPSKASQETLSNDRSYTICTDPFWPRHRDFIAPVGHIFVLGDNRANSIDSRAVTLGPVPLDAIIGKASYIYWSGDLSRIGTRLD